MRTPLLSFSLSIALHSCAADVRKWVVGIMAGYALAFGLMPIGGIVTVLTIGVGVAAAFHFIELQYGEALVAILVMVAAVVAGPLVLQ